MDSLSPRTWLQVRGNGKEGTSDQAMSSMLTNEVVGTPGVPTRCVACTVQPKFVSKTENNIHNNALEKLRVGVVDDSGHHEITLCAKELR
jgi:hypothetical protein